MRFFFVSFLATTYVLAITAAPVDSIFSQLSTICKQFLFSIVTDDVTCLPISQLWIQAISIDWENYTSSNIGQFTPLLDTLCTAPRCAKSLTNELVVKLHQDCFSDLPQSVIQIIGYVLNNYEPIVTVGCTRDSQQRYCLLEEGKIILGNRNTHLTDIPDNELCTECTQKWVEVYDEQYSAKYANRTFNFTGISQIKQRCEFKVPG
ncbi:hypothetical protein K493DRAFT_295688 [Basidiobolus meristosporus CBS 931.73]|uniref:DUF7729 domain-containing protein n=1 Tax=Basidiobolus meristosporus CBS 931.73 TaxID=1314790 RepID=A0A1Y1ZAJ1_9FUNG|nr:hypothetical protein K493DRAFT_295688 [Basidiobolus meristosporus CBS 931.73]|eukprot:ORY07114.1 hypothetical protein K493DRAFT_295688 [Basidiobolus meristosporus CBS 931.73]